MSFIILLSGVALPSSSSFFRRYFFRAYLFSVLILTHSVSADTPVISFFFFSGFSVGGFESRKVDENSSVFICNLLIIDYVIM